MSLDSYNINTIVKLVISLIVFIFISSILLSISMIPIKTNDPHLFLSIQYTSNLVFITWMIMGPLFGLIIGIISIQKMSLSKKTDFVIYFFILSGLCIPLCFKISGKIHILNSKYAIYNAQPIISAISSYQQNTGKIPNELSELVPVYLEHIPEVGLLGYRYFYYRSNNNILSQYQALTEWELILVIRRGFLYSAEELVFWPSNKYLPKMYGGHSKRIFSWVYIR